VAITTTSVAMESPSVKEGDHRKGSNLPGELKEGGKGQEE